MILRCLLLFVLCLAAPPAVALEQTQAQGPARLEVRSDSAGDTLALSDTLTVTVSVEGSPGLEVEPQELQVPGWTVLGRDKPTTTKPAAARLRWQQAYLLAPQSRGALTLQMPALRYRDLAAQWQTATWQPLTINVTSQLGPVETGKLRDLAQVETVPPALAAGSPPWYLLLAVPPRLLLVLLVYRYYRRNAPTTRRQPAREALRECERLITSQLPEQGRGERFITLLTTILRRYLERQYQLPARRQTTREFLQALADADGFSAEQKQRLAAFLEQCDLIKFARVSPSTADCRALADEVRRLVEETSRSSHAP